ncbi:flagellin [Oceanicaulis alexandrii]|uniref:flagellin n=1 Tax=Oceanicaulis alexandrii TaxID=153233 RepID=UPI000415D989|nr:flagellin [Oceanicaulis alexandrii]
MRISTQAASQAALMDLMRAQREAYDARDQLASGKKAPDLKGYANTAETIISARAAQQRSESFATSNSRIMNRLEIQDLAYQELSQAATDLRTALTTNDGSFMMDKVQEVFDQASAALNMRFNGSYVFGGVRTDALPFTADTIADLQAAAPDVSAMFDNAPRRQTTMIEETITIDINSTASEVGTDLMASIERIADFNAGPDGPFDGQITENQQAFLETELANIIAAFDTINVAMAENGSRQKQVENATTGHEKRSDYLTIMVAGIEDADMAEAATRFQQAQTAVQVSAQTFSTLSQISLLNYL